MWTKSTQLRMSQQRKNRSSRLECKRAIFCINLSPPKNRTNKLGTFLRTCVSIGMYTYSANTWKHSCIVELLATFSKCKRHIKMFTWKVFGTRILSCLHSWLKFSNLILCLIVYLLPCFLLHIYWCGTFKLEQNQQRQEHIWFLFLFFFQYSWICYLFYLRIHSFIPMESPYQALPPWIY